MERIKQKLFDKIALLLLLISVLGCNDKNINYGFEGIILDAFIDTYKLNPEHGTISIGLSQWSDTSTLIYLSYFEKKSSINSIDLLESTYKSFHITKNNFSNYNFLNDLRWKKALERTKDSDSTPSAIDDDNIQIVVSNRKRCVLNVLKGTTENANNKAAITYFREKGVLCSGL